MKKSRKLILATILLVLAVNLTSGMIFYLKSPGANQTALIPTSNPVDDRTLNLKTDTDVAAELDVTANHVAPNSLLRTVANPRSLALTESVNTTPITKTGETPPTPTPILPTAALLGSGLVALATLRKRKQAALSK